MAPLGPFGAPPLLAAGVSGGADSLALALLADAWARARGGSLLALIVDHRLRPESSAEAAHVAGLLALRGIPARILTLDLAPGSALQARARIARHAALLAACREAGIVHLLLGHHQDDQAETLAFRALRGSGDSGLAAMAAATPRAEALLLRPLLGFPAARLRATVAAAGLVPVEDPSNRNPRFARIRLRQALPPPAGPALAAAAAGFAARGGRHRQAIADRLARAASLAPEGFASIDPAALGTDAVAVDLLAGLVRSIAGAAYAPAAGATRALLHRGQGSLHGTLLRPWRGRWLLLREPAALAPPVAASHGARWDGRFRLTGSGAAGAWLGALGARASDLRHLRPAWPAALLQGLPAIYRDGTLVAVPMLLYPDAGSCSFFGLVFAPAAGPAGA